MMRLGAATGIFLKPALAAIDEAHQGLPDQHVQSTDCVVRMLRRLGATIVQSELCDCLQRGRIQAFRGGTSDERISGFPAPIWAFRRRSVPFARLMSGDTSSEKPMT